MIRILRLLVPASILAMFLCEAVLIAGCYVTAVYLDHELDPRGFLFDQSGWIPIAATSGLMLLGMNLRRLYSNLRIQSRILLLQDLSLTMGGVFVAEALLTYFQSSWTLPRNVLLSGSAMALIAVYLWRLSFSTAIRNRLGRQRVLFMGVPPLLSPLLAYLDQHPEVGFAPVGYLGLGEAKDQAALPKLGTPANLHEAVEQCQPEWIVIGGEDGLGPSRVDDLLELRFGGVHIEDAERFFERTTGRIHAASIRPAAAVLRQSLLPDAVNLRLQSMYSTLAMLVAIPLAGPLMLIIALVLWATSRQPVLLNEQRLGLGGVPFTAYRFRPLSRDKQGLLSRFGFEGLPQIWNVLRGEMALVGPSADRPEFAERLSRAIPLYSWRLLVHPGLIGWAQIRSLADGSATDAVRRLEYDLYYMKNLSPLLDLFILLRWLRSAPLFGRTGA